MTIITKLGHEHDRHHVFDSVGGSILFYFRILLALVFVGGCIRTYKKVRVSLKNFMSKFGVLGVLYVGSMPLVVWLANWQVAARHRN